MGVLPSSKTESLLSFGGKKILKGLKMCVFLYLRAVREAGGYPISGKKIRLVFDGCLAVFLRQMEYPLFICGRFLFLSNFAAVLWRCMAKNWPFHPAV